MWTGSGGTLFDITGTAGNGSMHMEGTIEYVETNRVVAFRGTWTEGADGRVRQRLEEFDLGGADLGRLVRRLLPADRLTFG